MSTICPHCKKPITAGLNSSAIKRAEYLKKEGHSLRNIEKILFAEKFAGVGTLASLSRHFAKGKKK